MNKLYFYGYLSGIGLFGLMSSIMLASTYFFKEMYFEIIGCFIVFLLCLCVLLNFTEKRLKINGKI